VDLMGSRDEDFHTRRLALLATINYIAAPDFRVRSMEPPGRSSTASRDAA
jgi:hypothetical protein